MSVSSFLNGLGGVTVEYMSNVYNDKPDYVFFKPYTSFSDASYRAMTTVSAPLFLSCCSALFLAASVYVLAWAAYARMTGDESTVDLLEPVSCATASALAAVVSPFANAVDMIGACYVTLMEHRDDSASEMNETAPCCAG